MKKLKAKVTHPKSVALEADDEVAALVRTLLETGRRLEELTGGEVDAVADHEGKMFLLQRAQEQLRQNEAAKRERIEEALFAERERAQVTLNSIGDSVASTDSSGNITFLNLVAEAMSGWSFHEATGRPMAEVFRILDGTTREVILNPSTIEIASDRTVHLRSNCIVIRRDGVEIPIEASVAPIRDRQGKGNGAVVVFRDLTERQAIERLKTQFVSTVSHELRTPLTSIRGALGLLASGILGPIGEKGQRMLNIAVQNTDRLVRLINDILDLERINSGRIELVRGPVDAHALMVQASEGVLSIADEAGVHLIILPVTATIRGDRDRLVQTLINLIGNAIKFSPRGTTVTLSGKSGEADFAFCVADQGRGIPEEKLGTIFERFSQVDASDSREKGGTGLGLAISQSIVHAHGGWIWVEKNDPVGSRFLFTIPLEARALDVSPAQSLLLKTEVK